MIDVIIVSDVHSECVTNMPSRKLGAVPLNYLCLLSISKIKCVDSITIISQDERLREFADNRKTTVIIAKDSDSYFDMALKAKKSLKMPKKQVIVVDGRTPFISEQSIMALAKNNNQFMCVMGTKTKKIKHMFDFNIIKMVKTNDNKLAYLSRAPVPWDNKIFHLDAGDSDYEKDEIGLRFTNIIKCTEEALTILTNTVSDIAKTEGIRMLNLLDRFSDISVEICDNENTITAITKQHLDEL